MRPARNSLGTNGGCWAHFKGGPKLAGAKSQHGLPARAGSNDVFPPRWVAKKCEFYILRLAARAAWTISACLKASRRRRPCEALAGAGMIEAEPDERPSKRLRLGEAPGGWQGSSGAGGPAPLALASQTRGAAEPAGPEGELGGRRGLPIDRTEYLRLLQQSLSGLGFAQVSPGCGRVSAPTPKFRHRAGSYSVKTGNASEKG